METQVTSHPQALGLIQPTAVQHLPLFAEGGVTVQDLHAQWAALLLQPQNHEVILDACAAPGGKTTHILEFAPQADVIALDVEENRLQRVKDNLARMQQQATVVCGDAANPQAWLDKLDKSAVRFDRILLDAPCSATGVIRRHPEIKWLRKEADIDQLVALQGQILDALWHYLKPNGVLLYPRVLCLRKKMRSKLNAFCKRHRMHNWRH